MGGGGGWIRIGRRCWRRQRCVSQCGWDGGSRPCGNGSARGRSWSRGTTGDNDQRGRDTSPACQCRRNRQKSSLCIGREGGERGRGLRAGGGHGFSGNKDRNHLFGESGRRPKAFNSQVHQVDRLERNGHVAAEIAHGHGRDTAQQAKPYRSCGQDTQGTGILPYSHSRCSPSSSEKIFSSGCLYVKHYPTNWS